MKFLASHYLFGLAGLVVVALVGFAVWSSQAPSRYDDFAFCLSEKGVTMYGAWWCPHCARQKALFGTAFDQVTYVECSENGSKSFNAQACTDVGIGDTYGVPLWKTANGTLFEGEQTLARLSEVSGCALPEEQTP